jgi:diaminopimelate epimerase
VAFEPDFAKYQGLGNDYLVLSPATLGLEPSAAAIRALCDRHLGPGADGLLLGPLGQPGLPDLRIFNPDGSEAEKSGNGLRIFVRHLWETGRVEGRELKLLTKGGPVRATVLDEDANWIRVDMGSPSFDPDVVGIEGSLAGGEGPLVGRAMSFGAETLDIACVSMGNPHCVVLGTDASEATARRIGPLISTSPLFRRGSNVQFLQVLSRGRIRIEIWERGAGYTLASGSSSCAAAAAARRLGLVDEEVEVSMPGGSLGIEFKDGRVLMTGAVEKVYEGSLAPQLKARMGLGPGLSPQGGAR